MGIFDTTLYYTNQPINLDALGQFVDAEFKEKYSTKVNEKQSGAKKYLTGNTSDNILVTKNSYHRLILSLGNSGDAQTETGEKEYYLTFVEAPSKSWMQFLRRQTGLVGGAVLRACFGSANEFHDEVIASLEKEYDLKTRKVGIGNLYKK